MGVDVSQDHREMKSISSVWNLKRNADQDEVRPDTSTPEEMKVGLDPVDKKKEASTLELDHVEYTKDAAELNADEDQDMAMKIMDAADDANEANEEEKKMTLWKALKMYPKAAGWSVLVSTTLVMEGYDTALLNALFALPVFQEKFGSPSKNGGYEIPSRWQIGLNMCVFVGEIIGLQMTGLVVERLGNRYTMMVALSLLFGYNFILYFCKNLPMIAVGQILSAMPWGCFQSLTVTYASEVCPLALRYYLTTYSNMCWLFGQILAAGIMKNSELHYPDNELGYKLPFALQWLWPAPLALGIFLAPESPWWLVRKGKLVDAKRSLGRILTGKGLEKETQVEITLEQIKLTIEKERIAKAKAGSLLDCFKGVDARRTRIACGTWIAQNSSGAVLLGYSTYFFQKAGMETSNAFTFAIIQYCLGLVGTLCSWVISGRFGRWNILTGGLTFQMVILFIIGGLGFGSGKGASNSAGGLLIALSFFYNAGIGAVVYCIVTEIPCAELRTQTVVLARNCYNLVAIINSILTPYMLNTQDWNWGAKTGLYWGGITALTLAWVIIDLPETTGRTFSEINELFALGVPARKFKSTEVDPFGRRTNAEEIEEVESTPGAL